MSKRQATYLAIILLLALGFRFVLPIPEGLSSGDWSVLTLFIFTIVGIVVSPFPIAVILLVAVSVGAFTGIITLAQALDGYSHSVTWIIVAAFLFARAFIKTGLGRRVALVFIRRLGSSSLRLGYAFSLTDLVLAPVTASNTARAGGIIFPVVRSLAREFGSEPGPSARKIGSYLLFTTFQANVVTSATFLTAMAANGVSVALALQTAGVEITWGLWFYASSVPAAISLLITPYLIHRLYPPVLDKTPEAQEFARKELHKLGPLTPPERVLVVVFVLLALIWAASSWHGIPSVAAALLAVSVLVVSEVLTIEDVSRERAAWETFLWFGGIISLAGALNDSGVIDWFVERMEGLVGGSGGIWMLVVLVLVYTYLHYGFASMTSQIIALYAAFLGLALAAGAPALLSALVFCFFSNLYATLTHYGDGAAPIFYGSGYISQPDWWRVGFVLSVAHLVVWLGIGLPWWRLIGIW